MERIFPSLLKRGKVFADKLCVTVTLGICVIALAQPALAAKIIRYEGSTTIGRFIDIARDAYGKAVIMMNVTTESKGGEECTLAGRCDIGGVAREVNPEVLQKGAVATLIGRDALAVIVNSSNPVRELTMSQLSDIFSGKTTNWKQVGGPDKPIETLITSPKSATHEIFKEVVLKQRDYKARVVQPDSQIVLLVSKNKWAVGQISFFFLDKIQDVRPINPDGQQAKFDNPNYPISRPLYLVTKGSPTGAVKDFIDWILSEAGQKLLKKFFVGVR